MNQIKWEVNKRFSGVKTYSAGTVDYSAFIYDVGLHNYRADLVDRNYRRFVPEGRFDDIDKAKEWAIAELAKHAKVAIAEANKSISAAQAFLGLVEGPKDQAKRNLPEFSDGVNE